MTMECIKGNTFFNQHWLKICLYYLKRKLIWNRSRFLAAYANLLSTERPNEMQNRIIWFPLLRIEWPNEMQNQIVWALNDLMKCRIELSDSPCWALNDLMKCRIELSDSPCWALNDLMKCNQIVWFPLLSTEWPNEMRNQIVWFPS